MASSTQPLTMKVNTSMVVNTTWETPPRPRRRRLELPSLNALRRERENRAFLVSQPSLGRQRNSLCLECRCRSEVGQRGFVESGLPPVLLRDEMTPAAEVGAFTQVEIVVAAVGALNVVHLVPADDVIDAGDSGAVKSKPACRRCTFASRAVSNRSSARLAVPLVKARAPLEYILLELRASNGQQKVIWCSRSEKDSTNLI